MQQGRKTQGPWRTVKALTPTVTANMKHDLTSSQENMKCHTEGLFTSNLIVKIQKYVEVK